MKKLKISAHDEYWEARAREIFEYVDRKDIDFFAELEKTYRNEAVRLQKSLFDFYTKYAEDHELTYQDATKRLRGEDLRDYVDNATLYREQAEKDPELLKRLNQQYASARAIRIEALQCSQERFIRASKGIYSTLPNTRTERLWEAVQARSTVQRLKRSSKPRLMAGTILSSCGVIPTASRKN